MPDQGHFTCLIILELFASSPTLSLNLGGCHQQLQRRHLVRYRQTTEDRWGVGKIQGKRRYRRQEAGPPAPSRCDIRNSGRIDVRTELMAGYD
jgi:hypothetical protein